MPRASGPSRQGRSCLSSSIISPGPHTSMISLASPLKLKRRSRDIVLRPYFHLFESQLLKIIYHTFYMARSVTFGRGKRVQTCPLVYRPTDFNSNEGEWHPNPKSTCIQVYLPLQYITGQVMQHHLSLAYISIARLDGFLLPLRVIYLLQ